MSHAPQIRALTLGAYQTNCYIVWAPGEKSCVVIDPGYAPERILAAVRDLELEIQAIFLTHGHFDHVGGVEALTRATGCALYMSPGDYTQPPEAAMFYPLASKSPKANFCEHGDVICAAGLEFTVWETPGHTRGSVCLQCGKALFTGDTLFAGSCGRTDLPGGNAAALKKSLAFLKALDFSGTIYPGHGEPSAMEIQRRTNPYLCGI